STSPIKMSSKSGFSIGINTADQANSGKQNNTLQPYSDAGTDFDDLIVIQDKEQLGAVTLNSTGDSVTRSFH
ncbi:hypothetical protein A2U01_0023867, partial [Trifolium medium]|nr:hypothetical protein [Trifolium medium]